MFFNSKSGPDHALHIKICAIDDNRLLFGGSNIDDHYLKWRDSNFLLTGHFNQRFHLIYDYLLLQTKVSTPKLKQKSTSLAKRILTGKPQLYLNIEPSFDQVKTALLSLINNSQTQLRIITWYFLPDQEIQSALIKAVDRGVRIEIINSANNRVPITNLLNIFTKHKLRKKQIRIWDWHQDYLHTKLYWNDQDDILMGSANFDYFSLNKSYEILIKLNNPKITQKTNHYFNKLIKEINTHE